MFAADTPSTRTAAAKLWARSRADAASAAFAFTAAQPGADGLVGQRDSSVPRLSAERWNALATARLRAAAALRDPAARYPTFALVESPLTIACATRRVCTIGTITPTLRRRVTPYSSEMGVVTVRALLVTCSRPSDSLSNGSWASVRRPASIGSSRGSCALPSESADSAAPRGASPPLSPKRSSKRVHTFDRRKRSMPAGTGAASSRCESGDCATAGVASSATSETTRATVVTSEGMGRKVIIGAPHQQRPPRTP